jgi:hypothetical protein
LEIDPLIGTQAVWTQGVKLTAIHARLNLPETDKGHHQETGSANPLRKFRIRCGFALKA